MWTLLLFVIIPTDLIVKDSVSVCEYNHYYDERGNHVFDQLIFRDDYGEIIDSRLIKSKHQKAINNRILWWDENILRDIRFKAIKETWTIFDPEITEREIFPKERRKGLRDGKLRKKIVPRRLP